jgi:hypothetical protein
LQAQSSCISSALIGSEPEDKTRRESFSRSRSVALFIAVFAYHSSIVKVHVQPFFPTAYINIPCPGSNVKSLGLFSSTTYRGLPLVAPPPSGRAACLGYASAFSLPLVARASLLAAQRWPAGAVAWRANARPGAALAAWKAALPVAVAWRASVRPGAAVAAWKAALQVPCLACQHLIFARTGLFSATSDIETLHEIERGAEKDRQTDDRDDGI